MRGENAKLYLRMKTQTHSSCPGKSTKRVFALDGPGIHVFLARVNQDVDGRDKPGHDEELRVGKADVSAVAQHSPSLRGAKRRSNPFFLSAARWIASLRSQ
jgi:hypothetical protein